MKALAVSRKILLEYWREPLLLGLIFAFPVILLLFYYLAFGDTGQGMAKHLKIMALNQDSGALVAGEHINLGDQLIAQVVAACFEGLPIFDLQAVKDRREAEINLREHKAALLLVIEPDFSATLLSVASGSREAAAARLSLLGYPSSDLYIFARSLLEGLIAEFCRQALGWEHNSLALGYEFTPGTGTMSDFEFGVAGLIVFGIMFLTISTAMTLVREEVNGTLERLRLTGLTSLDLMVGVTGAQLVLGVLMVLVTFGSARLMGFQGKGSLLLAILVGVLLSLSAVGLGLVTACFSRNESEAANLGAVIGVMLALISGAMYPLPEIPLATIAGQTIQLYDFLPPAHAARALQEILIFGKGFRAVGYELIGLTLLAVLILSASIGIYQRIKLR